MKWFLQCIRNYVNFSGRARRTEFWYFILFSILLMIVAMVLDAICFGHPYKLFYSLVALFLFLPQLAVSARRLHDTGRSAKRLLWNYLALLVWIIALVISGLSTLTGETAAAIGFFVVLCIGGLGFLVWEIFFLVWFCLPGTPGANKYGPDPKQDENALPGRPGGPAAPGRSGEPAVSGRPGETGINPKSEIRRKVEGSEKAVTPERAVTLERPAASEKATASEKAVTPERAVALEKAETAEKSSLASEKARTLEKVRRIRKIRTSGASGESESSGESEAPGSISRPGPGGN